MRAKAAAVIVAAACMLAACKAEQTAPEVPRLTAAVQTNPFIHVTPDGATQTLPWFWSSYQTFNVQYDPNPFTGAITLDFFCYNEGNARCTAVDLTRATLSPGQSIQVRADYAVDMAGSGRIVLSAEEPVFPFYHNVQDQGDAVLSIQRGSAGPGDPQIGPDNAVSTTYANGSGSYAFQVSWTFMPFVGPQTFGLTCRSTGTVTCTGLTPSILTLSPGQTQTVYASYTTAAAGSGYLVVARPGFAGILGEGGDVSLNVVAPPPPLLASIVGANAVQKGATCTWTASVAGGTPPYRYAWTWAGTSVGSSSSVSVRILISDVLTVRVTDASLVPQTTTFSKSVSVAAVQGCGSKPVF
jgi:hypothetical protein